MSVTFKSKQIHKYIHKTKLANGKIPSTYKLVKNYHIKSEMLYATSHIHERIQKHSLFPPLLLLQSLKTTCEANVVVCACNLSTWESE